MKPENKAFLDEHRGVYVMLVQAGIVKHIDGYTKERMLEVIREEFNPGYLISLWCGDCVIDMIKYCYIQYDKWIAAQPPILEEGERIVAMTFPVQEPTNTTEPPPNEVPTKPKRNRKRNG